MNYKLTCPTCKEKSKVSTHDGYKLVDEHKQVHLLFDCPKCDEEIDAIYATSYKGKKDA